MTRSGTRAPTPPTTEEHPVSTFIAPATASRGGPAACFRREVEVGDGLQRAILRVTALGVVEPYLNGTRVGQEVLAPTWTSYRHRVHLSRHDVTALLRPGANVLGAVVGDGWAVGPLTWDLTWHHYADRPAPYAELTLEYADRTEVVGTDASFRVGTGAVRENGIYAGEVYDARLEEPWCEPGFDDSGWSDAQPFAWDLSVLQEDAAPPVRRIEELIPVAVTTSPSGATIVDFGQFLSGWVRLTVEGASGDTVVPRRAELRTPEGELELETIRKAAATDRYTLRGGGVETWQQSFTFHGFRYVQVDGWPGELTAEVAADALRAVVVHTDMVRTGWFETSDELVNRLHQNTVWSMRGNFVGLPTDCPQRDERLGWTGDLNAFSPTAVHLYDVRHALGSWLQDLQAEQRATGFVPQVVPDVLGGLQTPTALWGDVAVSLPWLLYQEYGDAEALRRSYPSMTAFIDQVEQLLDDGDLWSSGFQYGDWLDPDAPADNPAGGKTDAHLVAQAHLCKTTRELAAAAGALGLSDDAARYGRLADRVRAAFRAEYVSPRGRVTNESATAYALAVVFGILDDDQLARAGDRLAEIVASSRFTISTGFAGTPLVTDALTRTGHLDHAYRLLLQTRCPSFLYPVTTGATTIWERWDSVLPDGRVNATGMTSLNHYALGAVADWLHRVVGGLQRLAPGWRRIGIAPRPGGGLTSARTTHDTVLGRAEVAWRVEDGTVHLDVTVPDGATARVELPLHPEGAVHEVGPGTHAWSYAAPADYADSRRLSLASTLDEIAADADAWQRVRAVLVEAMPGVPIDAGLQHAGAAPLGAMVSRIPGDQEQLRDRLEAALVG